MVERIGFAGVDKRGVAEIGVWWSKLVGDGEE